MFRETKDKFENSRKEVDTILKDWKKENKNKEILEQITLSMWSIYGGQGIELRASVT